MLQLTLSMAVLQDHIEESDFSSECKEEVGRDQIRSNQDYRYLIPVHGSSNRATDDALRY